LLQDKPNEIMRCCGHAIVNWPSISQHVLWEPKTHSNQGEDAEHTRHCDTNMPCSEGGCSQATTQRNSRGVKKQAHINLAINQCQLQQQQQQQQSQPDLGTRLVFIFYLVISHFAPFVSRSTTSVGSGFYRAAGANTTRYPEWITQRWLLKTDRDHLDNSSGECRRSETSLAYIQRKAARVSGSMERQHEHLSEKGNEFAYMLQQLVKPEHAVRQN